MNLKDYHFTFGSESLTANMTDNSTKRIDYPSDESTKHFYDSSMHERICNIPLIFTSRSKGFANFNDDLLQEGTMCLKSARKEVFPQITDIPLKNKSPKRPLTPFRPKSSPPTCLSQDYQQMIPTKGNPETIKTTTRVHSSLLKEEEKNRLRGGATIVAKLPYSRCLDIPRRRVTADHTRTRKADATTKCSSDLASMSSMSSTPRPQLLSLCSTRVRATSSSGQSSSEKQCCPYHIRVRKRTATTDLNGNADADVVLTAPRCRCTDNNSVVRLHSAISNNTSSAALTNKPPTSVRGTGLPKRALSIEDAIIQLSKRSNSPPSEMTGSSSSSSNQKKIIHRTLSTNRITDELRAKLGLTPPHRKTGVIKPSGQLLVPYKRPASFERIMNGHAVGTQTISSSTPSRCYSDSRVDIMAKDMLRCSRCQHECLIETGTFTCDTCFEVQRVKNAFVLEIFADRSSGNDLKDDSNNCYGVRVGAGLLPVVVMFMSLIICSVLLMSESVTSNVCDQYCNAPRSNAPSPTVTSAWGWWDPF